MNSLTKLHQSVGRAIAHWAHLEEEMSETLCALIGCDIEHAGIIMFSPSNFATKLEMLDSIFHHDHADKPYQPYWTDLVAYIRQLSGKRNGIAHRAPKPFRLLSDPEPEDRPAAYDILEGIEWGLSPHDLNLTRKGQSQRQKHFMMTVEEIIFASDEFSFATHLLRLMRFESDEFLSSDGIWPQRVERPKTADALSRLPRRVRLDPPRPSEA